MNRYENYKDTGLIWQKKIPYNWEVVRLKKIATFNTGNSIKDEEKAKYAKQDESRLYISTSDIDGNHMKINHKSNIYIPLKSKSFKIATKGSTLVCIEGGNGGKKAALVTEDVNFGNKLCAIKTYEEDDNYIYYLILSDVFKNYFSLNVNGDRNGVSQTNIGRFTFGLPPKNEQTQIANYLDWKISEINKLIKLENEKIEMLKELLEKEIENIIFNDSNKVSNSNWYKSLPTSSDEIKIKFIFSLRDERNHLPESEVDLISLYTKLGVIRNQDIEIKTGNKNTTVEHYKKVYEDDIVVNVMLCWMGAIGISRYNGVTSPAYDIYKPDLELVVPEYYHYMFRTNKFKSELFKRGKGIVLMKWRVYSDKFKNIIVPLPDIDEQKRIIGLIEEKKKIVLSNISIIKEKLTSLKELKQSLISEVVTGKIDVRNIVIPEYEKVILLDDDTEGLDEVEGIDDGD